VRRPGGFQPGAVVGRGKAKSPGLVQVFDLTVPADGDQTLISPSERAHDQVPGEERIEAPELGRGRIDRADNLQAGEGPHEKRPGAIMRQRNDARTGPIHIGEYPVAPPGRQNFETRPACRTDPPGLGSVLPFSDIEAHPAIWMMHREHPVGLGLMDSAASR
jgi:hypothetical protein